MRSLNVGQLKDFAAITPGALLLDVREPWEVALARVELPGLAQRHLPMHEVPARLSELDPSQPVVCICHHGARSAQVVAFLERQGHDHAYNLAGGIDAWSALVDPRVPRY
ncbi:MAG: sulfurtransferase [Ideonella sp. WA131b]|jgi:rhodanese-related sulfurtransferase|nr:sulfurtransferase [Ideonella sp. WA131b]